MMPADNMPMLPMFEMATAPVRGKRSDATASMVGQKKVLPTAYTPRAITATVNEVMPLARFKPTQARMAHVSKIATGEKPSFFSIKSAQNLSPNMIAEVQMKRNLPCSEVNKLPVMF